MIVEQDNSFLEVSRAGEYVELEFWSRGRHRGFARLPATQVRASLLTGDAIESNDGLRIARLADGGQWVVEYRAKDARLAIRLSDEEARRVLDPPLDEGN